jgi:hypothetical protein
VTLTTAARADEYKWVWVLQRAGGQEQRVLGGRLA